MPPDDRAQQSPLSLGSLPGGRMEASLCRERRTRVLIVEDDAAIGDLMGDILGDEGYQVTVVRTTAEALASIEAESSDIIVADLDPGYGDLLWVRIDRLSHAAPGVPIIVCTGHSYASKMSPIEHGVSSIILKPFEVDDFLTRVGRLALRVEMRVLA